MSKKVMAMIHSLGQPDEVIILSENGCNGVVAQYLGQCYTAIYNEFSGMYYVDDKYGLVEEKDQEF